MSDKSTTRRVDGPLVIIARGQAGLIVVTQGSQLVHPAEYPAKPGGIVITVDRRVTTGTGPTGIGQIEIAGLATELEDTAADPGMGQHNLRPYQIDDALPDIGDVTGVAQRIPGEEVNGVGAFQGGQRTGIIPVEAGWLGLLPGGCLQGLNFGRTQSPIKEDQVVE